MSGMSGIILKTYQIKPGKLSREDSEGDGYRGRMPCQQFQKVDFTCRIQQITCSFKK